MRRALLVAFAAAGLLSPVHAQDRRKDDPTCVGVPFDAAKLQVAQIKPGARAHFVRGGDGKNTCPGPDAACQEKTFLVAGDFVVAGARLGDYLCADFSGKNGARPGWLAFSSVESAHLLNDPKDFVGKWKQTEAEIEIRLKDGRLTADAAATYGAQDPERRERGAVNIGEFEGALNLHDGLASFDDEGVETGDPQSVGCRVRMVRAGAFLFVRDNTRCGGFNVSFDGVYTRKK